MNSVDTGFVTDETPIVGRAKGHTGRCGDVFEPPLDEVDGALRVLNPILNGRDEHGYFFEDYLPAQW